MLQAYASLGGQDTGKKVWSQLLGTRQIAAAAETTTGNNATRETGKSPVRKKTKKATKKTKQQHIELLTSEPVLKIATKLKVTPAQVLLRWALEQGVAVIPKTTSKERLLENKGTLKFSMTKEEIHEVQKQLMATVKENVNDEQTAEENVNHDSISCSGRDGNKQIEEYTRLCWRSEPLRHLDFD